MRPATPCPVPSKKRQTFIPTRAKRGTFGAPFHCQSKNSRFAGLLLDSEVIQRVETAESPAKHAFRGVCPPPDPTISQPRHGRNQPPLNHNLLTTISPTILQPLSNPAPTIGNLNPSTTTTQQREMGAIQFVIRWPKTIAQSAYFAMTTSSQTTPSRESDVPGARAKVALSSARPSTWRT